jgi:amidase
VTIRPTTGLTPRDLVIPFSARQDTVGPIARCVKYAATVLSIIAGRSENDERAWEILSNMTTDFTAACESINMSGIRLGIPRNAILNIDETQQRLFKHALEVLKAAGAEIIDHADLLGLEEFENPPGATKKMASEADFRVGMAGYLSALSTKPRNLKSLNDIIEWTKKDTAEEYSKRDVARMERAAAIDIESDEYKQVMARDEYFADEGGVIGALDRHSLDALVTISPVDTVITFTAKAESPVITVPVGVYPPDTKVKTDKDTGLVEIAPNIP